MEEKQMTGYPSIDKPWLKYYTEEAINATLPECTIYEYLWESNKDYQSNVALNYFDRKITYGEVFENIGKATKSYSALGLKSGDIVTVCAVTIPETIYTFYGLNRLGVICNMVDPRTSAEGIREYIKEVNSKIVITIDVAYAKIVESIKGTAVEKIVVISPADSLPQPKKFLFKAFKATKIPNDNLHIKWKDLVVNGKNNESVIVTYQKNTPCVIVHTGGTTGIPKGVMLSNDNLNTSAFQAIKSGFDFQRNHTWLNIMPPFIAYGVGNGLHLPLIVGMEVILIPSFNPNEFADLLNKYHPNHMVGVPSHYGNIIHNPKMQNKDLSYIIAPTVGGDAMDISLEKETNEFLAKHNCPYPACKGYGMSEVAAGVSICSSHDVNKIGSVGIPLTHTTMAIFDITTGKELPYNQEGEICMTGPNTMVGYYNNETETNNVIKKHDDGLLWVHSGDIGYIDEDGFVFIKDRIKRVIIRHDGFKVFPSLIEKTVDTNDNVVSNCAVGIADTSHSQGKLPIVFAVLKDGCNADTVKKELFELCQKELPEYVQPVDFVFIDKMPLTPIGKVDYRVLEEKAKQI
ncbi:MAG: acyl--CoA ligase [Ruminococcaceae bacterium]|nr:acyl--CoA ligase [Oscillospiraceae bacterium]